MAIEKRSLQLSAKDRSAPLLAEADVFEFKKG